MNKLEPVFSTPGSNYTVDDVLMNTSSGCFHWKLLFLTGLLWSVEAIEIMLLTFLIPIIEDLWDLQSPWDSMIGVFVFIGMFVGGLIFSKISDVYGRKKVIILCATILSLAGTLTVFVTNLYSLLVCRFFSGIGASGMIISLTLFHEMVPHNIRGKMMVFEQMFWSVGSIFSVFLAWIILPNMGEDSGWRVYVGLCTIPAWAVTISSAYIPESIRWYCTIGDFDKAEEIIGQILKSNGQQDMEGRLIRTEMITIRGNIKDMFVPKYRKTSFVMILLFTVSIFCYYGIVFVSERLFVGSSLYVSEFVTSTAELPVIGTAWFMDKIGRTSMISLTWFTNTIGFFLIAFMWFYSTPDQYLTVILVFFLRFSSYLNTIAVYLYFIEYYPTAIRATAIGLGYSMTRLSTSAAVFISEDIDISTAIILFGASSAIGCIISLFIVEDTTGKILTNFIDRSNSRKSDVFDSSTAISRGNPRKKYVNSV